MKKLITILIAILATQFAFGQVKKPTPKPVAKPTPTPTTTAKPAAQPTPTPKVNKYPDYKIAQIQSMVGLGQDNGMRSEMITYQKGVRQRNESRIIPLSGVSEMEMSMMANMAQPAKIRQCDLKQDVDISDKKKSYFIDYYDWSGLSPDQLKMRGVNKPLVIKGTATIGSNIVDLGKRQTMFGLQARWLKYTVTQEYSADSCGGALTMKMEQEGWFVNFRPQEESCDFPTVEGGKGGCRPKIILKGMANPGFFLEGTSKLWQNGEEGVTFTIKTTELSTATLDQALFEIPKDYTEVDSSQELMMDVNGPIDTSAKTIIGDSGKATNLKTIAIDFFSGNASKVNQDELRSYISSKVSVAGMSGFPISSQADLQGGNFVNVIGVELKKIKESGGAKIGGLFGKVTGNDSAAKLGDSEAEIVITIYGKDGKTSVASETATVKIKGSPNDAVKAAIDKIIHGLLAKIK